LLFKEDVLTIGHVGDSRCYFLRPHAIWQATRDHSLVQEKLRAGLITRDEAKTDRLKNVITRSVGFEREVSVELYQMRVKKDDIFLICSDGLSGLLEDHELMEFIQVHAIDQEDLKSAVDGLIEAANSKGGDDNITAILVKVVSTPPAPGPGPGA
jgi:PPM family protein phosphatase